VTVRTADARVLLTRDQLGETVTRLAAEITAAHPDGVTLVGVLKGALIFLADLVRAMGDIDVQVDFLAISRYAPDSGRVRIVQDLSIDCAGRDVVLVEDLVDTGLTLAYLLQYVRGRGAREVEVCALLDRRARRIVPLEPRYVGAEVPDVWVLGYGLHVDERYRNLPFVIEADRTLTLADPDAYLSCYQEKAAREAGARVTGNSEAAP
jgi:hypoxanthine phosphoribosyltransferase